MVLCLLNLISPLLMAFQRLKAKILWVRSITTISQTFSLTLHPHLQYFCILLYKNPFK
jgi:hypothetical protein